jgi:hypothetical protein
MSRNADHAGIPRSTRWILLIMVLVAGLSYGVPFFGLPISLCLPALTVIFREQLWSGVPLSHSVACSVVAWIGLWWPGITHILTGSNLGMSTEISTSWLIIPLCGPLGGGTVIIPALAAAAICGAGLAAAIAKHQPWLWALAAWLAPWIHHLTLTLLPNHQFIC